MTKGKAMIADLKYRTLSLFRRSSASSTRSASSSHSSEQHDHSIKNFPLHARKRPASSRSRSSLAVPKANAATLAAGKPVQGEEEEAGGEKHRGHEERNCSRHERERVPSVPPPPPPPQQQLELPDTAEPGSAHNEPQREDLPSTRRKSLVSSPFPLPTPEPSPLNRPDITAEPIAPESKVQQPSSSLAHDQTTTQLPDATAVLSASQNDQSTTNRSSIDSAKSGNSADRPPRNLHLDLGGGRPRALSAGKRSLHESHPRSPLHQSVAVEQADDNRRNGDGDERGQAAGQAGQVKSRLSQDQEPADYFSSLLSSPPRNARTTPPAAMSRSPSRYPQYTQLQQQPRRRKIWVKRPGASATMVAINEDDMVDDARDMILRKYANSLGKSFDSPDVTLRIHPREQPISASQRSSSDKHTPSPLLDERAMRPDEILCRTIDVYFPGGQSVEEALIIDTPMPASNAKSRRTPRHSPGVHHSYYSNHSGQYEDTRPTESDKEYFPPMTLVQPAINGAPSPRVVGALPVLTASGHPHSIAVINGSQLPPLPSPGSIAREAVLGQMPVEGGKRRHGDHRRPKFGRTHTSSPTIVQHSSDGRQAVTSAAIAQAPAIPTPPTHVGPPNIQPTRVATPPPPRVSSPRPKMNKRGKKLSMSGSASGLGSPQSTGLLASVPPINVLVVEDNIINLKLLEAFLKRLKVRSHSAKDGRQAVAKWREGGFHLVLMDIQLPLMNGLEATKEIRRLERVNGIGAFVKSTEEAKSEQNQKRPDMVNSEGSDETVTKEDEEKERLNNRIGKRELFKSPVIIVALTASSLHSDRSEALAAGCNDFLTKPVNLTWLERKLKEWGCMQALIDFDGWRQWKDFQSPVAVGHSPKIPQTPMKKGPIVPNSPASSSTTDLKNQQYSRSPTLASSKNPIVSNNNVALKELSSQNESTESTTTLDSMTSDDADDTESLETAMPPRSVGRNSMSDRDSPPLAASAGPSVSIQAPTPRQSTDRGVPQVDTATLGAGRRSPASPRLRSPANSVGRSSPPRSYNGDATNDAANGEKRERGPSAEGRRRKRGSMNGQTGPGGLSAVGEE